MIVEIHIRLWLFHCSGACNRKDPKAKTSDPKFIIHIMWYSLMVEG